MVAEYAQFEMPKEIIFQELQMYSWKLMSCFDF